MTRSRAEVRAARRAGQLRGARPREGVLALTAGADRGWRPSGERRTAGGPCRWPPRAADVPGDQLRTIPDVPAGSPRDTGDSLIRGSILLRRSGTRFIASLVAGLTGLSLTTTGTAAASAGPDRQEVTRALDLMTATGAAGAQVRITAGGRQLTARSGVARLGASRGVPVNGRFRIASVTKTFTATVILQLVGERRLALDDSVSRYLPGLLPDGDRITVRMLLQHSSGLHNYSDDLTGDPAELQRHWDPRDLVAMAIAHPLNFPPGTASRYSNSDYIVAGLLVEHLTGRPWAAAVRDRIIRPLGLHDTPLPGARPPTPGPHAHGYTQRDGALVDVTAMNPSVGWAAGEIISTTADLDTFTAALFAGR